MLALNPHTLRLASHAASALIRVVPKSKLAQMGLVRTPLFAVSPLAAAALGGMAVAAFTIPQSRNWIVGKANEAVKGVRQAVGSMGEKIQGTEGTVSENGGSQSQASGGDVAQAEAASALAQNGVN